MFRKQSDLTYRQLIDGVQLATLVHGEKTLMGRFKLARGSVLPEHRHSHEQTGLLISGRIVLTIDGTDHAAGPGDSWCVGSDVPHSARALENSEALEVFSPVREDYLE
ncbi:cupin domain-containing protein [Desulfosarcina ovata]|uniref:Cupin n=1 Tax=Desulfosarcina ovata subsp. ovata TaxID=2752305 RepID=A0A5K8A7T8_9BACT|nr:cupin domain-containing protein [Desulfosarcina ovata]BBO88692.1 cupin [Desulfosarcina ovata subsp. ovata]